MANIGIRISAIAKKPSDVIWSDVKSDSPGLDQKLFNKQAVRNSVRNILTWRRGERCLYPEFGNRMPDYVFETIDADMVAALKRDVVNMLSDEPRITVRDVEISADVDLHTVRLTVRYAIPLLNSTDSLTVEIVR